jgi:alpha/beta superfamily hydrolase
MQPEFEGIGEDSDTLNLLRYIRAEHSREDVFSLAAFNGARA